MNDSDGIVLWMCLHVEAVHVGHGQKEFHGEACETGDTGPGALMC